MNIVRWYIINKLKEILNIEVKHTYGAKTSLTRKELNLEKSHANDAYCIGEFHPENRVKTKYFVKRRRNNRCLETFRDAKIFDIRDGKIKTGMELSCGRTNRRQTRRTENNQRIFRGITKSKGKRLIRRKRHNIQAGDIILFKGKKYNCHGCMSGGATVSLQTAKESSTGKAITVSYSKANLIKHIGGWIEKAV